MANNSSSNVLSILAKILNTYTIDHPKYNGYIGINTDCEYCKNNKGTHKHFLDNESHRPYYNMDDSGTKCPYCMANPGIPHYHEGCK